MSDFDIGGFVRLRQRCVGIAVRRGLSLKDDRFPTFDELRKYTGTTKTFEKYTLMRRAFASQHVGLVGQVVQRFFSRHINLYGFQDLVHEGMEGVLRAIDMYDNTVGMFSTYATWWIRHKIQRAIENKLRMVRIPSHRIQTYAKQKKVLLSKPSMTDEDRRVVDDMTRVFVDTMYFRSLYLQGENSEYETYIPELTHDGRRDADSVLLITQITKVLDSLDKRSKNIIVLRFYYDMTRDEVGEIVGISRERVRQIENELVGEIRERLGLCR